MYQIISLLLFIFIPFEVFSGVTISNGKISGGTINDTTVAKDADEYSSEDINTKDANETQNSVQDLNQQKTDCIQLY